MVDKDGDGRIDFAEFCSMMLEGGDVEVLIGEGGGGTEDPISDEALEGIFREFDANGDGRIDISELKEALGKLGRRGCGGGQPVTAAMVEDDEVAELMNAADRDGDGKIDFEVNIRSL